jgi:trigger factor
MKRKIIAVVLASMMVLAAGCGGSKKTDQSVSGTSAGSASAAGSSANVHSEEEALSKLPVTDQKAALEDCIQLGNYKGLKLTGKKYTISDEKVKEYAKSMSDLKPVTDANAKAEKGDLVNIDFVGTMDGKKFDGGSSSKYDLELGSGSMISGFEDGIIGMKKGEKKTLNLKFPKDYFEKSLAGKAVTFDVTVNEIKRSAPATEEQLKKARTDLQTSYDNEAKTDLLSDAWKQVRNNSKFLQLRKADIDKATKQLDQEIDQVLSSNKMNLDSYLKAQGITKEDYNKQKETAAKERAKEFLLLEALAKAERVDENSADYQNHLNALAASYGLSVEELKNQMSGDKVYEYVMSETLANRLVQYAKVSEKEVSADEVNKQADSAAATD